MTEGAGERLKHPEVDTDLKTELSGKKSVTEGSCGGRSAVPDLSDSLGGGKARV